jgi:hypothetical protein
MASKKVVVGLVAVGIVAGTGCADHRGYEKAFSGSQAASGNRHQFDAPPDQTFQAVKFTLVQEGFLIDQVDPVGGLIKAVRDLADEKDKKISYKVDTTVAVSGALSGRGTLVTMAASQQTVTHDSSHNWIPLLGPLMIPMPGKKYSTTVTGEGTITDKGFYGEFFAAVDQSLREAPAASALASVQGSDLARSAAKQAPANATAAVVTAATPAVPIGADEVKPDGARDRGTAAPPQAAAGTGDSSLSVATPSVQSPPAPDNRP